MQKTCLMGLILFCNWHIMQPQEKDIQLNSGWQAKQATELTEDGCLISSPDYPCVGWMDAVVPGTVQTTLLHNELIPDMFYGMNNEKIPDIHDVGAAFYTYWFRNQFKLPPLKEGQQVWLKLRGVNYTSDVFLNGKRINNDTHSGMFLRQKYRITPFLNDTTDNHLAVIVYPPDPVGEDNGGQGGDGMIARSVTQQFTAGWDWICAIRDRNTGIWDEVAIEITGPVDIRDPFVKTTVPGVRFPNQNQPPAYVSISTDLVNATNEDQSGRLTATIGGKESSILLKVKAGKTLKVELPEIEMKNPQLWWPNGVGGPHLYPLKLIFTQDREISDSEMVNVGIRETGSYFDEESGGRVFLVNGQKVFIKGGNWIAYDALLRLSPERYDAEVRMHAELNMNMIRIWGGSMTERPEFYDACDKYGLLVWQDLWISGDGNGRWEDPKKKESRERRRAYPDHHTLFLTSAIDQIKMLRNHPSLYLWCGGNEFTPPEDINKKLKEQIIPEYDGTRYYLEESVSDSLLHNTIGGLGDGPYGIQDPLRFFVTPSYPFNPEIGSIGMPNVETMRRIMNEDDLTPPVKDRPNAVWTYHKYIGYGNTIDRLGAIEGIDDFCKKAQLVNYEQYRALQEGFNAGMWSHYTGMLVWKNQNPWTALRGQLYDPFLDQTGGFYGFHHGAKPLHLQLNLNDSCMMVINQTTANIPDLIAEATLFNLHGHDMGQVRYTVQVAANSKVNVGRLFSGAKPEGFYFVRLSLKDQQNRVLDENLYWLTNNDADWQQLQQLRPVKPILKTRKEDTGRITATVSNPTDETAFFIRLKVNDKKQNVLALPVFFEDNYFTLFPGEKKEVWIDISQLPENTDPNDLLFEAEAFNSTAGYNNADS
ncbi:MAG: glycoside hydrolase family 2 TIM barrel-domain containing protein [Petrimonas sp.]|nr:glycoside hydrolase family 2 TIM barrel-domain containing protein [Petrimonas sp.]